MQTRKFKKNKQDKKRNRQRKTKGNKKINRGGGNEINYVISDGNTIKKIDLFDATGRIVISLDGLNTNKFTLNRNQLNQGLYFSKIELGNKTILSKKIIIQ